VPLLVDLLAVNVRHRFPGLADGWVRLDGPAGTLPVDSSIGAMVAYLRSPAPANQGGRFDASVETTALVEATRVACARLLGSTPEEVVFGANATTLMFAYTRALAQAWGPGDVVVVTRLDHDANVRPWVLAARDTGAEVAFLPVDPADGTLDLDPLDGLCAGGRVRWVAVSGASNLHGVVPDLARVVTTAHAAGARVHLDAVARVPHLPTSLTDLGVDSLVTSPYKWYGPHAGVLVARREILQGVEPYRVRPADYPGPERWETGTKAFEVLAGVRAAAEFLAEQPWPEVVATEGALLARMEHGLRAMDHVTVHGPVSGQGRAPTSIFTVAGWRPDAVAAALAERRVAVWSGDNYACELVDALGLRAGGGVVRAGVVRYTDEADVDALLEAVADLRRPG
jgi:cysteine desulfurase family protein (TIGR01976 family)